jgi:UDP-N-acetyl-D-glucosamine dehydrogenase
LKLNPFPLTTAAININDTRGVHAAELTCEALHEMVRPVEGTPILLCGASYREDVGDTRYSGSELVVRKLTEMGADMRVHDPYVDHWYELENQDAYPAAGHSKSRFFRNQAGLVNIRVQKDLAAALKGISAVILAVRHAPYLDLDPDWLVEQAGGPVAVIDCFAMLSEAKIRRLFELGCEVRCLGRGHVSRIKASIDHRGPSRTS